MVHGNHCVVSCMNFVFDYQLLCFDYQLQKKLTLSLLIELLYTFILMSTHSTVLNSKSYTGI